MRSPKSPRKPQILCRNSALEGLPNRALPTPPHLPGVEFDPASPMRPCNAPGIDALHAQREGSCDFPPHCDSKNPGSLLTLGIQREGANMPAQHRVVRITSPRHSSPASASRQGLETAMQSGKVSSAGCLRSFAHEVSAPCPTPSLSAAVPRDRYMPSPPRHTPPTDPNFTRTCCMMRVQNGPQSETSASIQGYLAQKKPPPPRTLPLAYA